MTRSIALNTNQLAMVALPMALSAAMDAGVHEMTYAIDFFQPGIRLRDWFEASKMVATGRRAQRRAYNRTLAALQSMPDRDLADIGVSRLSIKEIAHEAAYGDRH